jgi:hypothetical protein
VIFTELKGKKVPALFNNPDFVLAAQDNPDIFPVP